MSRIAISTTSAPAAIGPYSQAIRVGDLLFSSGQIALDPATGNLVAGGIEAETQQVLANLAAVLTAAGATWADVAKTTIFLADLADFAIVNRLYGEVTVAPAPARSTVQVAALPRGARVEIEVIAHLGKTSAPAT
jgi:2-iminobutanoate/2-iminopropanoate deaminase